MGVRILKHDWPPKVRELYAGQFVFVFDEQDTKQQYLVEMRSGPIAGEFRWFREDEFLPQPPNTALSYE